MKAIKDGEVRISEPDFTEPLYVYVEVKDDGSVGEIDTNLQDEYAITALARAQLRLVVEGIPDDEFEEIPGDAAIRTLARSLRTGIGDA